MFSLLLQSVQGVFDVNDCDLDQMLFDMYLLHTNRTTGPKRTIDRPTLAGTTHTVGRFPISHFSWKAKVRKCSSVYIKYHTYKTGHKSRHRRTQTISA